MISAEAGRPLEPVVGPADLLVLGAAELLVCPPDGEGLGVITDGAMAVAGGVILWVGSTEEAERAVSVEDRTVVVDATGCIVMPGIVECHAHLAFGGSRAGEFQLRLGGLSYEEISRVGGGIMATVRATRKATWDELLLRARRHLDRMLAHGITTVEAKSGYGLTLEEELRLLEIYRELNAIHPATVVPTFLGAHTVPQEWQGNPEGYVELLVEEMIPAVAARGLASFCDVFCEDFAFSREQSRRILAAGLAHGLKPKIHADQLSSSGGAELAAELGAVSADHLDRVSPQGIQALVQAGVTAVLLPGATFFLGSTVFPPARDLLEAGAHVALSTDFNPGTCYSENPFLMGTIASCYMKMTATEVLRGLTCEAARALGLERVVGSLEPPRQADFLLLEAGSYVEVPYHFGVNPVAMVVKAGEVVVDRRLAAAEGWQ